MEEVTMRKVLLSAITAFMLASVAQAADGVLPTDEVREAAPIGLVGEPWPLGSELQAVTTSTHAFEELRVVVNPDPAIDAAWLSPEPMMIPVQRFEPHQTVFVPHGPFMTAVDPDGTIVESKWTLVLVPREFSAMAQEPAPLLKPRKR